MTDIANWNHVFKHFKNSIHLLVCLNTYIKSLLYKMLHKVYMYSSLNFGHNLKISNCGQLLGHNPNLLQFYVNANWEKVVSINKNLEFLNTGVFVIKVCRKINLWLIFFNITSLQEFCLGSNYCLTISRARILLET